LININSVNKMKAFPPLNFDNLKEYFLDRSVETT